MHIVILYEAWFLYVSSQMGWNFHTVTYKRTHADQLMSSCVMAHASECVKWAIFMCSCVDMSYMNLHNNSTFFMHLNVWNTQPRWDTWYWYVKETGLKNFENTLEVVFTGNQAWSAHIYVIYYVWKTGACHRGYDMFVFRIWTICHFNSQEWYAKLCNYEVIQI